MSKTPIPTEEVLDLGPFRAMVMTIGTLPTAFTESMTYYEALAYFVKYLEEVTQAVNINAEATKELQELFVQLKSYVDNYFDNLDVQEEINNKLDEMAQSGELEAILQEILNTLRVYDTVGDMIADEAIQNGQRVLCFGYTVKTDNGGGIYSITNEALTGNGLTIIELDNGLFALKEYSDKIIVADQSVLTTSLLTELLNNSIELVTENPIEVTETIEITEDGASIRNMEFVGNTANNEYVIHVLSDHVTIENCKFTGVTGNYLRVTGGHKDTNIVNNTFDGTGGSTVSPVVAWSASSVKLHGNTFLNNKGFNVQFIKTSESYINDNSFTNRYFYGSYTTSGGETSIQFNTGGITPTRKVVRIDGEIPASYTVTYDAETSIATITLNSAVQGVKTVTFRCYESLEMININSHCKDINISGNTLEGTGDSGIVVGTDYHHNSLNPASTTYEDRPINVNINNNIIRNCYASGIAITHVSPNISIENNTISNYGWGKSDVYSSGVFVPFSYTNYGCKVCNNTFSNSSTDRYGETENGIGLYGVVVNPAGNPTDSISYSNYMKSPNKLKVLNNTSDGSIKLIQVYPFSNLTPQLGYVITPSNTVDFGVRANQTTADGDYGALGANNATVSVVTDTSTDVINIDFNESGDRYCNVGNSGINLINNANLKIGFYAKSDVANEGTFRVVYIYGGSTKQNADLKLTNEWKYYEYSLLINGNTQARTISCRFAPTSTCRNIKFKDYHMTVEYFN